jgi:hypothetical protein
MPRLFRLSRSALVCVVVRDNEGSSVTERLTCVNEVDIGYPFAGARCVVSPASFFACQMLCSSSARRGFILAVGVRCGHMNLPKETGEAKDENARRPPAPHSGQAEVFGPCIGAQSSQRKAHSGQDQS